MRNRKKYYREYRQKNKGKILVYAKMWNRKNPLHSWASHTHRKHRKKGFFLYFTIQDLIKKAKDTFKCELCNCDLDWTVGKKKHCRDNSPTLDKIQNETRNLSLKDIQIICLNCNAGKGSGSMMEYIMRCRRVCLKFDLANRVSCGS